MKCARVKLTERIRYGKSSRTTSVDRPRRYCQRRMVNPDHEEDSRWIDALKRFHCLNLEYKEEPVVQNEDIEKVIKEDDLFLSVQNLQFQGNSEERRRPKSCFKYKAATDGKKHRLFVREAIDYLDLSEDERSSQLTTSCIEDYMKYISYEPSRPCSSTSSIFNEMNSSTKNKVTQVKTDKRNEIKKNKKIEFQVTNDAKNKTEYQIVKCEDVVPDDTEDTKVAFHISGKRKSLTISRVQSPESVQVIRVDVVCTYSTSSYLSDYDDPQPNKLNQKISDKENVNIKGSFARKYLLTNALKPLDEKAGRAKVTLMCKTFKLTERGLKTTVK